MDRQLDRPVRILLVTRDSRLSTQIRSAYSTHVEISNSFSQVPAEIIIVDSQNLGGSSWQRLIALSRLDSRPSILFCGRPNDDLHALARLAADGYIRIPTSTVELVRAIECHCQDHRIRLVATRLSALLAAPPQLYRFIKVVFDASPPLTHVGAAADAIRTPETTLRRQLHAVAGRSAELKHIVRLAQMMRKEEAIPSGRFTRFIASLSSSWSVAINMTELTSTMAAPGCESERP